MERTYDINVATDLPADDWWVLKTSIPATPPTNQETVTVTTPQAFFSITVRD